ncbi:hypothetical protein SUGI_0094740 [Cryptomeria japonica]|nr:hypothetical protein SUGI_0094740 [Cryptomeria japonica]
MLESKAKIIPVFYQVDPWELHHIGRGQYADAFSKFEEKGRYLEKLSEWKEALQFLSFIAGEEFNRFWVDMFMVGTHSYWKSELTKAITTLPRDVKKRLKISFDSLDDEQKHVFMETAYFFVGRPKNIAETVWEGSGWNAQYALETLR